MTNIEVEIVTTLRKHIHRDLNGNFLGTAIPEKKIVNAKRTHELGLYENILFLHDITFWGSATESFILTENGMSLVAEEDNDPWFLSWKHFDRIEYIDRRFHLFENNKSESFENIDESFFGITFDKERVHGEKIAEGVTKIARLFNDDEEELFIRLMDAFEEENFKIALDLCDEYMREYGAKGSWFINVCYCKASVHLYEKDYNKAQDEIICIDDHCEENDIELSDSWIYNIADLKGQFASGMGDDYIALANYNLAMEYCEDSNVKRELKEEIERLNRSFKLEFLNQPYNKRKIILTDKKQGDMSADCFQVLSMDEMPDIKFPIGHPLEKEMYVGHPFNNNVYLPFSTYEETLFNDRFQEFSYFLQCLGAKRISIEVRSGKDGESIVKSSNSNGVGAEVGLEKLKVGAEFNSDKASENIELNKNTSSMARVQEFSPIKSPFIPPSLIWYPNEPSWQRLFEQRVNGNLLSHSETLSTNQYQTLNTSEKNNFKQSVTYYFSKVNINNSNEVEQLLTERETTEWIINVEFVSIDELTEDNNSKIISGSEEETSFSSKEERYLEEIEFMLEDDGQIDDDERRVLVRKREKFGISEERALELEKSLIVKQEFTQADNDYIEELKEIAVDGKILEADYRILKRLAVKLGLSEERANELEQIYLNADEPSYTESELKYIEEIEFCLEDDGEISVSERRLLNKERESLQISIERAEEIEQAFIREIKKV